MRKIKDGLYKLDEVDLAIIKALTDDARLTYNDLADKLRKQPAAMCTRYGHLVDYGIIKNFTVDVDWDKVLEG